MSAVVLFRRGRECNANTIQSLFRLLGFKVLTAYLPCLFTLYCLPSAVFADPTGFQVTDAQENEIRINILPARGDRLLIWFLDRSDLPPEFDALLQTMQARGMEVWTVELHELVRLDMADPAPSLELEDILGRACRLDHYRGRVSLVNFWTTWCPPCGIHRRYGQPSMIC